MPVNFLTMGKTTKRTGKATSHEIPQEPSHIFMNPSPRPWLRNVLMNETMHVIK